MILLQDSYINTGEIPRPYSPLPAREIFTQQIVPPARRPDAGELPPVERVAFAVLTDSGELPISFVETPRPRPEETARIVTGASWPGTVPAEPPRPRRYVGAHRARLVRSRAALAAAIAEGGAR